MKSPRSPSVWHHIDSRFDKTSNNLCVSSAEATSSSSSSDSGKILVGSSDLPRGSIENWMP